MIAQGVVLDAVLKTIKKAACQIPKDIYSAFEKAIEKESFEGSRRAFGATFESLNRSIRNENIACPDTGWPLFFYKIGNEAQIEGGIMALEDVSREAVERATKEGYLRSTMKHPLTGFDPGNNVGMNVPGYTYKFVRGDSVEVTYVAKGGGSECLGGTRYRMVGYADGVVGIEKFIVDSYIAAARAGGICPPAVLGVGIGGTCDMATKLAKQAAVLRTVGSRHPEPMMAKVEDDLFAAINELKIGAMGLGGEVSVFAVNVEYSYSHIMGIAVAMSANCWIARRATTLIESDGTTREMDQPDWFGGR